jgi:sRNA-binding protein
MMRALLAATLLGLAGCSGPASTDFPEMTEGEAQKAKMDLATTRYSDCITAGAREVDVNNDAAGSIANRVVLACKEQRNKLMADVTAFHQLGHPKFSIAQSKAVAEASIATIEDELRRQAVVTVVTRQLAVGTPAPTNSIVTESDPLTAQPKVTF